jgi:hypothetical protein
MVANMTLTETSISWLPIEPCIKVRYDSNCSGNEGKIGVMWKKVPPN